MNKGNDIHEYIEMALDTGFSHIDTAQGDDFEPLIQIRSCSLSFAAKGMETKKASLSPSERVD